MEDLSVKELGTRLLISVTLLLFVLGSVFYVAELYLQNNAPESLSNTLMTIVIVITSIILVNFSRIGFSYLHNSVGRLTPHQKEVSYRFIQISVYLTALFLIVTVWKIDVSNILIGAGALGILAGLAARQALSSVLSGIIIMTSNMFKVGEWIQFEDKFGRVTKITFFNTHFSSHKGEKHIIPNDSLTSKNITNISEKGKYRKDLIIGVDYDCDLEQVIGICNNELADLKSDKTHGKIVGFNPASVKEFDDSCIELAVKVWIDSPTPMAINQIQTTVFKRIHSRFKEEDVEIPFQQMTISHRSQNVSKTDPMPDNLSDSSDESSEPQSEPVPAQD